jgi:hypothetical protein
VVNQTLSLTDEIYAELVDGLQTGLDWTQFLAKHGASKGPLYNAVGRFFNDMEAKVKALAEVQAKLDQAGLKLDSLDRQIKEAESSLAPLEEKKNALNERIETLESKLTEKSELLEHAGGLGKLGFDIERLRQLREALTEIGAKSGLTGREAVGKFFDDLKDYEAVLEAKALLEGLQIQIETLETRVAEKSELLEYAGELGKLGLDIERLRQLQHTLREIGAKHGLKGKEVTNKFFDDLKDYDASIGFELELITKRGQLNTLAGEMESRSRELDTAGKRLEGVQRQAAELRKELATYQRLEGIGFNGKALGELEKAGKKYGTPRKVLIALNRFAGLSDIKTATEDMKGKLKQEKADIEAMEKKHLHLKSTIEMCEDLLGRKFSLQAITLIRATATKYGEAVDVIKAIEAYGSLKEIEKKINQANTELLETEAKIQRQKEVEAEYQTRIRATLEQFEALNAKAIEVGCAVGTVQEQSKKDTMARDLLNRLQNPLSASYEEYLPLALVLLKSISVWANINKDKFRFPSLIDKNLEELTRYLGGS